VDRRSPAPAASERRHFEGGPTAVREARGFVHEVMAKRLQPPAADDLGPILSELATNAVHHSLRAFDVVIEREPPEPRPPEHAPCVPGSSEVRVVSDSCARWGLHLVRDEACVWCGQSMASG
jgi:hypothetical protein